MGIRSPASTATAAASVLMKVRRNGNPLKESSSCSLIYPLFPRLDAPRGSAAQPDILFAQFDARWRAPGVCHFSEEGFDEDGHEHPQEERKRAALWMKQNKAAIRAYIQGMVLVEPSAASVWRQGFAVMFGKFWGYPLHSAPAATTLSTSPSI